MQVESRHDIVFYDGECGLCHGSVLRLLKHDRRQVFRFAPLQGETFLRAISPEVRSQLPDSLVVLTSNGQVLVRSAAAIHVLRRLGHTWAARLLWLVPKPLRDTLYDAIARHRTDLSARPSALCPIVPVDLRPRFLP
jgi:predicted DCC family thiol-disulfide oxidoreductase YuxK